MVRNLVKEKAKQKKYIFAALPMSWQRRTGIQCLVEAHKSQHLPPPQSKLEFDFKQQNDSPPLEEDARDV
jgi:hypothetical protein